ncbi:MAG: S8 family serine peptidase, partial [Actinomycetes bacterium]
MKPPNRGNIGCDLVSATEGVPVPNHRPLLLAALSTLPLILTPSFAKAQSSARVIVAPSSPGNREAALSEAGATPITGLSLLSVPAGPDPTATAKRLGSLPGVKWAEPDVIYRAAGADPRRSRQWALTAIHVERGWALAGSGGLPSLSGPAIAIVDTGADISHDDLRGRIRACAASFSGRVREGACDDKDGHGTHTAGIAAASTDNGIGIAGVAPSSPLLVCRALGPDGGGSGADVAACVGWASKRKAKVTSGKPGSSASQPEMSRPSRPSARQDTGARGAANRPKSASQPALETRTRAPRCATPVRVLSPALPASAVVDQDADVVAGRGRPAPGLGHPGG